MRDVLIIYRIKTLFSDRRSVQDLRESQSCNLSNVVSEVDLSRKQEVSITLRTSEEKKNQNIDSKLHNRYV